MPGGKKWFALVAQRELDTNGSHTFSRDWRNWPLWALCAYNPPSAPHGSYKRFKQWF